MKEKYSSLMSPWHQRAVEESALEGKTQAEVELPISLSSADSFIVGAHRRMIASLCEELLGYIYAQSHGFFENLIIDVMLALGYGGRRRDLARRIGGSGDGGVDGIIEMDELGLDVIYLQAKRLKLGSMVPVSAVRDFVGSLEARHAVKGIFVTTGNFTPAALSVVEAVSKKIVLINGQKLTELMVRHNIGIKATETFQFKELDRSYFTKMRVGSVGAKINSASTQPRK
jgi:restriction system protein